MFKVIFLDEKKRVNRKMIENLVDREIDFVEVDMYLVDGS